ncbi:MAG: hypothetical protein C0506_03210 [Anaerolinea sp.]|nr:hypothetical protein [Anaerolinea sp.]
MHRPDLRGVALVGVLVAGAWAVGGCGGGGDDKASADAGGIVNSNISNAPQGSPTPRPEAKVKVSDNAFTPATLTVKSGTKVIWEWSGSNPHSILLGGQSSGEKTGSGTYERTFDTPGSTINYQCGIHGAAMSGKIVVE